MGPLAKKLWPKSFNFSQRNFLAITFKPVVRSIPNFEWGKICRFLGLFAKSVSPWSQYPGTFFSKLKFGGESLKLPVFMVEGLFRFNSKVVFAVLKSWLKEGTTWWGLESFGLPGCTAGCHRDTWARCSRGSCLWNSPAQGRSGDWPSTPGPSPDLKLWKIVHGTVRIKLLPAWVVLICPWMASFKMGGDV